jgi:hypothetical protein
MTAKDQGWSNHIDARLDAQRRSVDDQLVEVWIVPADAVECRRSPAAMTHPLHAEPESPGHGGALVFVETLRR